MEFKDLIKKVLKYNPKADVNTINEAYKLARDVTKEKIRLSGDQEINHNLSVASYLASVKADDTTLIAGLLHNVLDVKPELAEKIREEYGQTVLTIIEQTKKSNSIGIASLKEPEKIRKLLVLTTKDPRTLLIKMCNKLDTLKTVGAIGDEERRKRICTEALSIYSPIAHRLGMHSIKVQLEDYAFMKLEPEIYKEIWMRLNESEGSRIKRMKKIESSIKEKINKLNLKADVKSRTKHIYSIHKKVTERGYTIERMYDTVALRVVLDKLEDCYLLLGVIQEKRTFIPGTFKDYVASPKPNGYQSIHISILDDFHKPVEIQIRTKEMDYVAEEGVAAHTTYKGNSFQGSFDKGLDEIKKKISLQDYGENPDLFKEHILVKTPKGDIVELPINATVLDFAYKLHTNLGDSTVGAYVNGKPRTIQTELNSGDLVEVTTRKNSQPGSNFLKIAKTKYAQEKIRVSLRKQGKRI